MKKICERNTDTGINSLQVVCWRTTVSRKVYRDELSFVDRLSMPQCNVIHAPFKACTLVYQFLFVLFYSGLISQAWPTVGLKCKIWRHCQLHSGHTDFSTLCLCSNKVKNCVILTLSSSKMEISNWVQIRKWLYDLLSSETDQVQNGESCSLWKFCTDSLNCMLHSMDSRYHTKKVFTVFFFF